MDSTIVDIIILRSIWVHKATIQHPFAWWPYYVNKKNVSSMVTLLCGLSSKRHIRWEGCIDRWLISMCRCGISIIHVHTIILPIYLQLLIILLLFLIHLILGKHSQITYCGAFLVLEKELNRRCAAPWT